MVRNELVCRHKKPSPSTWNFPSPVRTCRRPGELAVRVRRVISATGASTINSGFPSTVEHFELELFDHKQSARQRLRFRARQTRFHLLLVRRSKYSTDVKSLAWLGAVLLRAPVWNGGEKQNRAIKRQIRTRRVALFIFIFIPSNAPTNDSHFPCARKIISTTSRTAPRPPAARVTKCAAAFASATPSATATENPARFNGPKSTTSSPTKQTSFQLNFSCAKSSSIAPVLLNRSPCWTRKWIFNSPRAISSPPMAAPRPSRFSNPRAAPKPSRGRRGC